MTATLTRTRTAPDWVSSFLDGLSTAAAERGRPSQLRQHLGNAATLIEQDSADPDDWYDTLVRLTPDLDNGAREAFAEYLVHAAHEEAGWATEHTGPLPLDDLSDVLSQFAWDLVDSGYDEDTVSSADSFMEKLLADPDQIAALLDAADHLDNDPDGYEIAVGPDGAPLLIRYAPDGGLVLDLFAAPGGWSEGIRAAHGIHDIGIEWSEWACKTRAAAGHRTIRADVSQFPLGPLQGKVWGLISSPPCWDWSAAGKKLGLDGPTGWLTETVITYAEALRPAWVAAEQTPLAKPQFEHYAARLRALGYRARVFIVQAADYGVPQTRKRVILLAHRKDFADPTPTHAKDGPTLDGLQPWITMQQALGWGFTHRPSLTVCAQRPGSGLRFEGGSGARKTFANEQLAGRWAPRLINGAFANDHDRKAAAGSGRMGRPTPGELGVLQGFPLNYPWQGPRHANGDWMYPAYAQVGNAVPPPLAAAAVAPLLRA